MTSEARGAHTAGPWRLSDNSAAGFTENDGGLSIISDALDEYAKVAVAVLRVKAKRGQTYRAIDPERDANARLIAAAPALLEALHKMARDHAHDCQIRHEGVPGLCTCAFDEARSALALASGKG